MNIEELSTGGLHMLHKAIAKAVADDDATVPPMQKPFGAREEGDFKRMGDAVEAELRRRGEAFNPVQW